MIVKDYTVEGNSAREIIDSIKEEHTRVRVSRIKDGVYKVHLELDDALPEHSYISKGWYTPKKASSYA